MIVDRPFYNIKCDACGRLFDDETWWDDKDALTTQILYGCIWIECDGRHYCGKCWEHNDDYNIVTKDGRKWTGDHKEIRQHRMNYLSLSEDMTLTQFRMELVKGKALFDSMVCSHYKSMLFDDLTEGKEWLEELLVTRKGTPEFDSYSTFASHGIFRLAQTDAHERMYNLNK